MPTRWLPRHRVWLWASLAVTLLVVLPLLAVTLPTLHRQRMVARLGSADDALREQAMNFVLREAPQRDDVRDEALRTLPTLPPGPAMELFGVFDRLESPVSGEAAEALVRALQHADHATFTRGFAVLAARGHGNLDPLLNAAAARLADADAEQFADLFTLLDNQQSWARARVGEGPWLRWIGLRAASREPETRRTAALLLAEPFTTRAWPAALEPLLCDDDASVRRAAWYAAGPRLLEQPSRAAPCVTGPALEDPTIARLLTRLGVAPPTDAPATPGVELVFGHDDDPLAVLHRFETSEPAALDISAADGLPPLQRVLAVRAAREPRLAWLDAPLRHDDPAVRDLACHVAAQRFTHEQLAPLIDTLLDELDPVSRMSGAVLAGLAAQRLDVLEARLTRERDQRVALTMRLGLWAAGRLERFGDTVPSLIDRDGFPATTALLALLHRRDARGFELLFAPDGLDDAQLAELLVARRFAWVLRGALPDDAPMLPLWTPDAMQADAIAELRAWGWLHRWRIADTGPTVRP